MPPVSDPLFDSDEPTSTKEAEATAKPDTPSTPPQGVTQEQFDSLKTELAKVGNTMGQMQEFFQLVSSQASTPVETPKSANDDFSTRFYTDPENALSEKIGKETLPVVQAAAKSLAATKMSEHRSKIDREFGDGTWDEIFAPHMSKAVDDLLKVNPMVLFNDDAIANGVSSIRGKAENFTALHERANKFKESLTSKEAEQMAKLTEHITSQIPLTGGMRRSQSAALKLDDEDSRAYLRARSENGGNDSSEAELVAVMSARHTGKGGGMTLEDFKSAQEAARGSK